jgi:hypothetical protein
METGDAKKKVLFFLIKRSIRGACPKPVCVGYLDDDKGLKTSIELRIAALDDGEYTHEVPPVVVLAG